MGPRTATPAGAAAPAAKLARRAVGRACLSLAGREALLEGAHGLQQDQARQASRRTSGGSSTLAKPQEKGSTNGRALLRALSWPELTAGTALTALD